MSAGQSNTRQLAIVPATAVHNRLQYSVTGNHRRKRFAAALARGGYTSIARVASCRLAPQRPQVWIPGMF
jgi:hypothetical protein